MSVKLGKCKLSGWALIVLANRKSRDPGVKLSYKLVSSTAFSNRHSLFIKWSKPQEFDSGLEYGAVETIMHPRTCRFTMEHVATPDAKQSLAYVSVFALFQTSIASGRDDKSYQRLSAEWKDYWAELQTAYKRQKETAEKNVVRRLKSLVDTNVRPESDDDEVLTRNFKKRRDDSRDGTSSRDEQEERSNGMDMKIQLQDIWRRKSSAPAYQQMSGSRQNLPMWQFKEEALKTVEKHQVTVLRGETGTFECFAYFMQLHPSVAVPLFNRHRTVVPGSRREVAALQ